MSYSVADQLFQSRSRCAVLTLLFLKGMAASASELARRSGLSVRGVAKEVKHLQAMGLVSVSHHDRADLVRANGEHPAAEALRALLRTPSRPPVDTAEAKKVRESLVAWGAPLAEVRPVRHYSLEETVLRGLVAAEHDGTVFRTLPTLLARRRAALDWAELKEGARQQRLQAPLGLVAELTGEMLGDKSLARDVEDLHDRRRKQMRFFPVVKSSYEEKLAMSRSPAAAKRWGFWTNVTVESLRSTWEAHRD